MPQKVHEDDNINVVQMLMSIKSELASLNSKVEDLQDVDSKAEHANDKATYAINKSKDNEKSIRGLKKKQDTNNDHRTQYLVAIVGSIAGPILMDILLKALHVIV